MYVQHFGYFGNAQGTLPNPYHFGFDESGMSITFAEGIASAINTFRNVQGLSSKMQVSGLNADGPITGVQDELPDRYGAMINAIRRLVSRHGKSVEAEHSITFAIGTRCPIPTSFAGRWSERRLARHVPSKCLSFGHSAWALFGSSASKGIAVPKPAEIMGITKASSVGWVGTSLNRALVGA
jgi:hypothetical protein